MLGRIDPSSKEVTIIGAGISGLLAAYYLDRAGYEVTLLEAQERAGGLIATLTTPYGAAERAAHSFPASPILRELCAELGVKLDTIRPESKARYIYRDGRMRKFPLGPVEAFRAFLRAYLVLAPAKDPESLTLEEWGRRFLGESALTYLLTPFIRGIYGTEPREIAVSAAFPGLCVPRGHSFFSFLLAKLWRKTPPTGVKRAVPKVGKGEISSPSGGMQTLTSALEKHLEQRLGARFRRGEVVTELPAAKNRIVCVPAHEAASLFSGEYPELSQALSRIRYSGLTSATIFVKRSSLARVPKGLGVLIAPGEGRRCLGVLFNSSSFPGRVSDEAHVSLTMMLDPVIPEGSVPGVIREELGALFGMRGEPLHVEMTRRENAVPKYDLHLLKTWELAEHGWCSRPGHVLFGNYTGQVSIRGMAELARGLVSPRTD